MGDDSSGKSLQQYAESVVRFSSHYGRNVPYGRTSAYSAYNLAGSEGVMSYGDHTEAMVLRTYGPWWSVMPSYAPPLGPCPNWFMSEDFIELQYDDAIFPEKVVIRETYHPGSIVRILACNLAPSEAEFYPPSAVRWQVLWSGSPQADLPHEIRNFEPPLRKPEFPTRLLRLEFNSQLADYYTELDCCKLCGPKAAAKTYPCIILDEPAAKKESLPEVTEKLFRQLSLEDHAAPLPSVERQVSDVSDAGAEDDDEEYEMLNGIFDCIPFELWFQILSYLDFHSLCRAARVNRTWFRACYDPLLCRHINLQPFWTAVNDTFLEAVEPRFGYLKSLDISWTGACNQVSAAAFDKFLRTCCSDLRRFRAVCSPLVSEATLIFLNELGGQLEELDVRSCSFYFANAESSITDSDSDSDDAAAFARRAAKARPSVHGQQGFLLPQLSQLRRLNLYGSVITTENALKLIRNNPLLEHVNVGNCNLNGHEIATALGTHCKHLKSLDLWRSLNFSSDAVLALADGCPDLLELDFGWLTFETHPSNCLVYLAEKCPRLTKLFLTATRTERDADLIALATNCPDLQQLDLLGCSRITAHAVEVVLKRCKKMSFLDISFCNQVQDDIARRWREEYPHVAIKKSYN